MPVSARRVAAAHLAATTAAPKDVLDGLEVALKRLYRSVRSHNYDGRTRFSLPDGSLSVFWKTSTEGFWMVHIDDDLRREIGWGVVVEKELGPMSAHFPMTGAASTIVRKIVKAVAIVVGNLETWKANRVAPTPEPEPEAIWSVAWTGYQLADAGEDSDENEVNGGYVMKVETFSSESKAVQHARDNGPAYVVRGTQMWNEPLGQVEEHDRHAPTRLVR